MPHYWRCNVLCDEYCDVLDNPVSNAYLSLFPPVHSRRRDAVHEGRVNVRRLKNGFSTIHPLRFDEREAIERWSLVRAGWKAADKTDALFISRRGTALSRQQAYRIIRY